MKTHGFKGSGPGFKCQYVAGSEEGARQCGLQVADPIHNVMPLQKSSPFPDPILVSSQEPQHWPGSAEAVWQAHSALVADKLTKKRAYGDAWMRQGYMGNLARIMSKAARLENMLWRDQVQGLDFDISQDGDQESVMDTLIDLSAMCSLMIANLEDGNRWGR